MHASSYESVSARRRERGGDNTSRGKRESVRQETQVLFRPQCQDGLRTEAARCPGRIFVPRRSFLESIPGIRHFRWILRGTYPRALAPFESQLLELSGAARESRVGNGCAPKFTQLVAIVSGAPSHVSSLVMRPSFGSVTRPPSIDEAWI